VSKLASLAKLNDVDGTYILELLLWNSKKNGSVLSSDPRCMTHVKGEGRGENRDRRRARVYRPLYLFPKYITEMRTTPSHCNITSKVKL